MKPTPLALLCSVLASTCALADVTITQQIEQPQQKPMTMVMKIKDGMVRNDVDTRMSAIIDTTSGETTTLMHDQKVAMKVPGAMVKAAQALATKSLAESAESDADAAPTPTGRKEVISGFNCEEFVSSHQGKKIVIWVTQEIPDAKEITRQFASLASDTNPTADLVDPTQIEGFPIRTTAEIAPGQTVTMTVMGLTREPIPASEFAVPSGYREMAMPQIPIP